MKESVALRLSSNFVLQAAYTAFPSMEKSGQALKTHGASVFIFGTVLGGTGFKPGTLCRWKLVAGRDWVLAAGAISGSTQCGMPGGVRFES